MFTADACITLNHLLIFAFQKLLFKISHICLLDSIRLSSSKKHRILIDMARSKTNKQTNKQTNKHTHTHTHAHSPHLRKTTNNEHDWTPIKYLNVLHHNKTQKQLGHFFLHLAKILSTSCFEYFGHIWPLP